MDVPQKDVVALQKTKKKKTRFFETYISKVLKQVSDSNGITSNSKQQLNSALCLISRLIATTVITLTEMAKKKTMSEKEVKNALLILLPEQLAANAILEGQKAVTSFEKVGNVKGTSRQEKASILFSPAISEKFLRNFGYSKVMVTSQAPVYMAGALEYLTSEILENASASAKDNKRIRINIRDLELGVRNDNELNMFFTNNNISFLGGGVTPFIHKSLLSKKIRNKKRCKKVEPVQDGDKKKHRFRPGTVSLREIRRFQKMSNCLTFAKFPFEKLVRQVVKSHNNSPMKISKEVFIVLQYFIEQQLTTLLRNANFAAIHAGRVKLMPIDIEFVNSIARGTQNPYQIGDIVHIEEDQIVNDEKEEEEEEEDNVEDEKEEDEDNCGEEDVEDEELLEEE
jgi:histone H3